MLKVRYLILALICVACAWDTVPAQSTIFNVPSTDTVEKRRVYVEADFISHLDKYSKGGYQTYGYRMNYGLTKNIEVGGNFFYTHDGSRRVPYELQANIKWNFYENEKLGVALSAGAQVFIPLNKPAGRRTYAMVYANASKTVRQLNGARVTAGAYQMLHTEEDFGDKRGFIFGYEQPLRHKFSFLADWYTGNNRFGYAAAGFGYAMTSKQAIYVGYNWGNSGAGNNAFSFYYGYTF
jgi:hypothetical protein